MWKKGLSWTKGKWTTTTNPDNSVKWLYISSGPFFFIEKEDLYYFYIGARPTPPWSEGYGDEGIFPKVARWLKRHGFGNYGVTLRIG